MQKIKESQNKVTLRRDRKVEGGKNERLTDK